MSQWDELGFEDRVRQILSRPFGGEFGQPFFTAYQLAIEVARDPVVLHRLSLQVGGQGIGEHVSLAQYLARELTRRIRSGQIADIERAWLSDENLTALEYRNRRERGSQPVRSSLTGAWNASLYRLRG